MAGLTAGDFLGMALGFPPGVGQYVFNEIMPRDTRKRIAKFVAKKLGEDVASGIGGAIIADFCGGCGTATSALAAYQGYKVCLILYS
jgi:hypothetical protein